MQVRREMSLQIRADRVCQRAALLGKERAKLPRSVTSHWHWFIKWFFTCKFHQCFVDIVRFWSGGAAVQQIWIIQEMELQHSWKINCVRKVSVVPPSLLASFYCSYIYIFLPYFLSCLLVPVYLNTWKLGMLIINRLIDSMNFDRLILSVVLKRFKKQFFVFFKDIWKRLLHG